MASVLAAAKGAVKERAGVAAQRAEEIATAQVEAQIKEGAKDAQRQAAQGGGGGVGGVIGGAAVGLGAAAVSAGASTIAPGVVAMVKQAHEEVPPDPPVTCWCGAQPMEPGCGATSAKVALMPFACITHLLGCFAYSASMSMNWYIFGMLCCCPQCCMGDARKRIAKTHGRLSSWLMKGENGKPHVVAHILKQARNDPETGCVEGCHYCLMNFDLNNGVPEEVVGQWCAANCCGADEVWKSSDFYGHGVAAPCQVCLLDSKK